MSHSDEEPYDEVEEDLGFGRVTLRPVRPKAECAYCGKVVSLRETGRLWYHGTPGDNDGVWCPGSGTVP